MNISIEEFLRLRKTLPVADVRSEGEFEAGHIGSAVNIPILNNAERVAVGTDYKQKGQLAAIKTGFRLVGPRILEIVNHAEQVAANREMLVHCWRGGMRSSNFCQFLGMARIKTHQLTGGYKAYRAEALAAFKQPFRLNIIGGYTGSGKSEVLRALEERGEQIIDLEALASHKGSVFGGLMQAPQPTTEQFQNDLFEKIKDLDINKPIWVEDESITIGKLVIPDSFWRTMGSSPIIALEVDKNDRVDRLVREYGPSDPEEFLKAMSSIVKKLGGQHFLAAKEKLMAGDMAATIDILLVYYDKAYGIGLTKNKDRVKSMAKWDGKNADEIAASLILDSRPLHQIRA